MEEGYEKVETLEVIYDPSLPKELRELRIGDTVNLKVDDINLQCIVTEKCDKAFYLSIKPVRPEEIREVGSMITKRDIKQESIKTLQFLMNGIQDGKIIVIDINGSRYAIEKPIHETSGIYKEYEPSREYKIEFTLANKEEL
jgi:hypothetical protein